MLVTLACPYDSHSPGDTIETDDAVGALLIHDGVARLAVGTSPRNAVDIETATATQLRDYAKDEGIPLAGARSRSDLAAVIGEHLTRAPQPQPDTGATHEETAP